MNTMTSNADRQERVRCSALLGVVRDIEATQAELKPLMARLERLNRERADLESAEFIAANSIRKQDVELCGGEGKPWFGTSWEFGKWLASHSKKVWAEWNGRIYHTTDLVNGRMPDMKGRTSDLA